VEGGHESTELRMEASATTEESAGALNAYPVRDRIRVYRGSGFLAEDWPQPWRESFVMSDQTLPLTPTSSRRCGRLHEVVDKYRRPERQGDEIVWRRSRHFHETAVGVRPVL